MKRLNISDYSIKNYSNKMYINTVTKKVYMYNDTNIVRVKNINTLKDIFKVFRIK